jgi:hypothetical protein
MVKADLNPLKKWILSNKFYIKTTDTKEKKSSATHFLLDGGIWGVPKERYPEFLNLLAIDLQNGEKHYICENRTSVFKFICDIDMYEESEVSTDQISRIIMPIQEVVTEYFGEKKVIICGADSKTVTKTFSDGTGGFGQKEINLVKTGFHLVWPDIWISVDTAKKMRILFIEKLTELFGERENYNSWDDVVDLAVYEDNGLRMVGSRKIAICKSCKNKKEFRENCVSCEGYGKKDENRIYSPKLVLGPCEKTYFGSILNYNVMLYETSIYNYNDLPETLLIKECNKIIEPKKKKNVSKNTAGTDETILKVETFIKRNYKNTHSKIKIVKLVKNENCYFAEPDDNFCINVNRNHTSSGVYFQITSTGICQKCYCKKETLEGRSHGMCKHFGSPEIPLTKVLQTLLFGTVSRNSKNRKIVNMSITKNASNDSLDLSVSSIQNYKQSIRVDRETCLMNCRNILFQIENEFLKK